MANPEDGKMKAHDMTVYQIVLLYKHRWDIEKILHQFKSSFINTGKSGPQLQFGFPNRSRVTRAS